MGFAGIVGLAEIVPPNLKRADFPTYQVDVLVFKVMKTITSDQSIPFTGSVRLTTADGGPVPGFTVTLGSGREPEVRATPSCSGTTMK